MASSGTLIVKGTSISSPGSNAISVTEKNSQRLTPRVTPVASWLRLVKAVPVLMAVKPSAAYSVRVTGSSPLFMTSASSAMTAPGASSWEK